MKKITKQIILIAAIVVVLAGGGILASSFLIPCQVTANGKTLVTVKNEEVGKMVMRRVIASYVPEDSSMTNVTLDKELKLEKGSISDAFNKEDMMTGSEAIEYITDANNDNQLFSATIQSEQVKQKKFTPDIEYKEDKDMFAGESRVEKEGKDGVKDVTYEITSVNGEVQDKKAVSSKVVKEGEPAVVYKGTMGLPEGEDWKTYEGAPVYNDGDDVVAAAKQHLGAPYKYGGKSFKTGIDCVQYVRAIFRMYGVNVPNSHGKIQRFGKGVSMKNAQPGDIICYKHHVAIYVGNGKVAEATKKGTKIGKVRKGVVTVRRVTKR